MSPLRRLWNTIRRAGLDDDLRQELETHLALIEEEERALGLAPEQARHKAKARFGSPLGHRERTTDAVAVTWLTDLGKDVRFAARSLARTPGFSVVALLTLAWGIGVNTALFSIFSSLILRPLPVRDPDSLALLTNGSWSYPVWQEIKAREAELFDGAFGWSTQSFDLSPGGKSDLVDGAYVTGGLFDVLGVTAIRGRMITPADDGGTRPDARLLRRHARFQLLEPVQGHLNLRCGGRAGRSG